MQEIWRGILYTPQRYHATTRAVHIARMLLALNSIMRFPPLQHVILHHTNGKLGQGDGWKRKLIYRKITSSKPTAKTASDDSGRGHRHRVVPDDPRREWRREQQHWPSAFLVSAANPVQVANLVLGHGAGHHPVLDGEYRASRIHANSVQPEFRECSRGSCCQCWRSRRCHSSRRRARVKRDEVRSNRLLASQEKGRTNTAWV